MRNIRFFRSLDKLIKKQILVSSIGILFAATTFFIISSQANAQEADLSAMQIDGYNLSLPPTATSTQATTIQNGFRDWMSNIGNNSQTPVTNATISLMSGYDPALFDPVLPFPHVVSFPSLAPGEIQITNKLLPGENHIPVSYTLGYDSTKTTSTTSIPSGGGQQTVTVTITPRDFRYISSADANVSFNIFIYGGIPGVTITSTIDPDNLDQGENIQTTNNGNNVQWQLAWPQLNKTYTFTAVLDVPNQTGASLEFQPVVQLDGQRQVAYGEFTGPSVTIIDPTLDGDTSGSGSITFSVNETDRTWSTRLGDLYGVVYQGTQPAEPGETIPVQISVKPRSKQPAPINPKSKGKIPVAIFSSDTVDARTIIPSTVLFGPMGPTKASPTHTFFKDIDRDGRLDMILHFRTKETGIVCGVEKVSLSGQTTDGRSINGSALIRTVGCR